VDAVKANDESHMCVMLCCWKGCYLLEGFSKTTIDWYSFADSYSNSCSDRLRSC